MEIGCRLRPSPPPPAALHPAIPTVTASPAQMYQHMTLGCQQVSTVNSCLVLSPSALRFPGCTFPFTWYKRVWHTPWPVLEPESRLHLLGKVFLIYCLFSSFESEVAQSCLTLFDPMDCSPPGSSVHGISQARILEWIAISFSRGGIKPRFPTLQVDAVASEPPGRPLSNFIL